MRMATIHLWTVKCAAAPTVITNADCACVCCTVCMCSPSALKEQPSLKAFPVKITSSNQMKSQYKGTYVHMCGIIT